MLTGVNSLHLKNRWKTQFVDYSRRSLSRTSRDPIKKFELSVVRDNQSVTSRVCLGVPIVCHKVLGRHKYEYSELKTLSCPAVELLLFVFRLINSCDTNVNK